ncbi:gp55 protein [Mycobacteroides abscessus subsp. abscessus]|uniref:Gp55 protein n=2 Tax=Mycobacteroides abscessus TaxID=36809 RepID=A0AB33T2U0_9MYCO|nr:gp55 protein [Mycobacteroides abscessus]SHY12287.1 gp55 protein [Mycobacteroides abscessus subsp. abscessus]CPT21444.1 gp55 protein [Mycobacteroides abscessus]CPT25997.1 gp55 protein [Mycobacteroides abscessus]CPU73259.1 gp55 protein [Mycobacteroides abscessus]
MALMSPISSATIGHWLHRATGHHNLEDYIGLDLYVLAATAVVMDALHHLDIDRGDRFRRFVEVPATLTIPTLLPLFALGGGVRVYHPDIFRVPVTDGWFLAFWLVLCSSLIYFLIYAMRSLVPLWKHRPSRRIAGIYMTATASGILACLARITTAFMPSEVQDTMTASLAVWVPALGCGAIFALAAGWVWVSRTRLVPL